jgi:hypothetical protein
MTRILKATLATAFAVACLGGATATFAANSDHGVDSSRNDPNGHQTINRNSPDMQEKLDYGTTGSITTCDRRDSIQHAGCYHGLPRFMK